MHITFDSHPELFIYYAASRDVKSIQSVSAPDEKLWEAGVEMLEFAVKTHLLFCMCCPYLTQLKYKQKTLHAADRSTSCCRQESAESS